MTNKEDHSKKEAIQKKYDFANFILMNSFASENSPFIVSLGLLKTLQFTYPKTWTCQVRGWPDYSVANSWSSLEAGYPSPTSTQKWSVQPLKQKTRPVLPYLSPGKQTSSKGHLSDVLLCNSEYRSRSPPLQCPASPVQLSCAHRQKASTTAGWQRWLNMKNTTKVCVHYRHTTHKREINEYSRNRSKTVPLTGSTSLQPACLPSANSWKPAVLVWGWWGRKGWTELQRRTVEP